MQVAVIGPLRVTTDAGTRLPVPGAAERLLLARLAAAVPEAVSAAVLADALGRPEPDALHRCLTSLRGCLEPGLPTTASGRYVLRHGPGYLLAVPRGDVDARRFAALAARGRERLAAGEPAEAVRLLAAARQLWRGEPYADWPAAAFAIAERRRLTGLRAAVEADLAAARRRAAAVPPPAVPPPPVAAPSPAPPPPRESAPPPPAPPAPALPAPAPPARPSGPRSARLVTAGVLVAALLAAGLAVHAQRAGEDATARAQAAEANALAGLAPSVRPVDLSFLLAAQAFRLADTADTRAGLRTALVDHPRLERVTRLDRYPAAAAILSGRSGTLAFGARSQVVSWSVGPESHPRASGGGPADWSDEWLVAVPSPDGSEVLAAGVTDGVPWVRMVAPDGSSSRLLLQGAQIGGRPLAGAYGGDGRARLLVTQAAGAGTRWRVVEVGTADGSTRDLGLGGSFRGPEVTLGAHFGDDGRSVVLWDVADVVPALFVDVGTGERVTVRPARRHGISRGFRALPGGVAQLWNDGTVTLFDAGGTPVQELQRHLAVVRDVTVSPDGTWAVSAGAGGQVFRWQVDPVTGRWSRPQVLDGHTGDVLDGTAVTGGRELVTVAADQTAMRWAMGPLPGALDPAGGAEGWLREVCTVAGRNLTRAEWDRYLPDRPYRATCTDPQ